MVKRRSRVKMPARADSVAETEDALRALYESLEPDRPIEAYIADPRLAEVAARAFQRSRWRAIGLE